MKCPIDDSELVMTERHGVEIDYCPKCRGVWLDRGELDKIIDRAAGPVAEPEPPAAPVPPVAPAPPPRQPEATDPRVWQEPYRSQPQRRDWDDDDDDRYRDDDRRYRKRRKRKSFLEDIFDFD